MKNVSARLILFLSILSMYSNCSFTGVIQSRNITYSEANKLQLDVYAPKKTGKPNEVLVFIHGGNWNSGKKSLYRFLGNRMARKGVVTVIINYRLSPLTDYKGMTTDAASALTWVKQNICSYGGNDNKIFVSGHSAGGHLAALISTDHQYFDSTKMTSPIKGTILIDAFGLDMYAYLSNPHYEKNPTYLSMFATNPQTWKDGSPRYHLHDGMPPFLVYVGGKTYPYIKKSNADFLAALRKHQPDVQGITLKNKKHVAMITQFFNTRNKIYKEIIEFMKK